MPKRKSPGQRLAEEIAKLQKPIGIHSIGLDRVEVVGAAPLDGRTQFGPPKANRVVVPRKLLVQERQRRDELDRNAADAAKTHSTSIPTRAGYLSLIVDKRAKTVRSKAEPGWCDFSKTSDQWHCFLLHYEAGDGGIDVKVFLEEYSGRSSAARQVICDVNKKLWGLQIQIRFKHGRRTLVPWTRDS